MSKRKIIKTILLIISVLLTTMQEQDKEVKSEPDPYWYDDNSE